MNSQSSHGAEVRSIRKLLQKYNNMNREELKRLWFNIPHPTPKKEVRVIKVSKLGENHYECKKVRDDKAGYSTYSSSWKTFDEALEFARKLMKDTPEFSIIIN